MTESDHDILLQTIASKNRVIADLRAAKARLERENAELRACANIDEALGAVEHYLKENKITGDDLNRIAESVQERLFEDDPDRQTAGQRKWHLYFDGLYNEMPY